jgi:hypothetical protein
VPLNSKTLFQKLQFLSEVVQWRIVESMLEGGLQCVCVCVGGGGLRARVFTGVVKSCK